MHLSGTKRKGMIYTICLLHKAVYLVSKGKYNSRFKKSAKGIAISCIVFAVIIFSAVTVQAQRDIRLSKGQTIYVPIYSHIYFGDKETPFYLAVTVSIRNIDQANPITVTEVSCYDGRLIKKYLKKPMRLGPNASTRFVIKESDDKGGSGASFIVKWRSDLQVNAPIIESIMIGTQKPAGSFFYITGTGSR